MIVAVAAQRETALCYKKRKNWESSRLLPLPPIINHSITHYQPADPPNPKNLQGMADRSCKPLRIILFCPSLSKLSSVVAWDDHRLDLGTIARTFGIDPATLKLNGHFIGRGADLVASSVTWRSLLSFFSSRGLSTGTGGSPALLVDGKLSKSGAKRAHDPGEFDTPDKSLHGGDWVGVTVSPQINPKKMKTMENSPASGCQNQNGLGLKRRLWQEAISPLKRSKMDGTYTNVFSRSYEAKGKDTRGSGASKITCSYQSETMKRVREEQVLAGAACKRTR